MVDKTAEVDSGYLEKPSEEQINNQPTPKPTAPRRKLGGFMSILAKTTLAIMSVKAGLTIGDKIVEANQPQSDKTPSAPTVTFPPSENPSGIEVSVPVSSPNSEPNERQISKEAIEQKFGIRLLTMEEAFLEMGRDYDVNNPEKVGLRPPVRWSDNDLIVLDELLSQTPKSLYEELDGKKFGIFIGDFGTDCGCGGAYYPKTGILGLSGSFNPDNKDGDMSLLIHETTHRYDELTNYMLWPKLRDILAEQKYLDLEEFQFVGRKDPDSERAFYDYLSQVNVDGIKPDDVIGAISTLSSLAPNQGFVEGVAGISQRYVTGRERFMRSFGPLLDNGGYESANKQNLSSKQLVTAYPKTEQLYNLYKNEVFKGKEYTGKEFGVNIQEGISTPVNEPSPAIEPILSQDEVFPRLSQAYMDYGTYFLNPGAKGFTEKELSLFENSLAIFPSEFLPGVRAAGLEGMKNTYILFVDAPFPYDELTVIRRQLGERTIALPKDSFNRDYATTRWSVLLLAHDLALNVDGRVKKAFEEKLIHELGGEKYLKSPSEFYPRINEVYDVGAGLTKRLTYSIFSSNPDEVLASMSEAYVLGVDDFTRIVGFVTDPEFDFTFTNPSRDFTNTKAYKLYSIMRDFYKGNEYHPASSGVPINVGNLVAG